MSDIRIGYGYDVHQLVHNRPLILGGVNIDYPMGLAGHSDADVLLHAISDALLGAMALGDIGTHFPDNDETFRNIDSRILLREIRELIRKQGYHVGNVDSTIAAQQPRLSPYIKQMRDIISKDLEIDIDRVSVKATTTEQLGFEGRKEGISARAAVLILGD